MWCFLLLTLFVTVQGRAVNISNTWVLPEEGFPVFYRYFRDRISWYEADAVCQFHHANLVTVDTTAQYDAVRAYLKELDISSAVWVGLIRSNPDGDFTWTDYRGLSGDGYWSSAPDARTAPLCAAADPTADYRWEARACGGPSVASFICELPVPQWALGNEGCMVRALPALTILYLPESAAVQLTADCGLAGVKRVQCTGNMKREDLLTQLSCNDEEQTSDSSLTTPSATSYQTTTDSNFTDQDNNNGVTTEENVTTEHEDDINQSTTIKHLSTSYETMSTTEKLPQKEESLMNNLYRFPLEQSMDLDILSNNNLLSNDIPKLVPNDEFFTSEDSDKIEDDRNLQHKKLHDELSRLGNFETIFSQPTDHFVPPLVMAKAKLSDDMTALSIEEKLAQQLAERQSMGHENKQNNNFENKNDTKDAASTKILSKMATDNPLINIMSSTKISDYVTNTKNILPKKYNNKYDIIKEKSLKNAYSKSRNQMKSQEFSSIPSVSNKEDIYSTSFPLKSFVKNSLTSNYEQPEEDESLELTVIIKEPELNDKHRRKHSNYSQNENDNKTAKKGMEYNVSMDHHVIMNNEVIKIEIINERNSSRSNIDITVYEVTTKVPVLKENTDINKHKMTSEYVTNLPITLSSATSNNSTPLPVKDLITASINPIVTNITSSDAITQPTEATLITVVTDFNTDTNTTISQLDYQSSTVSEENYKFQNITINDHYEGANETDFIEHLEKNDTNTTPEIDDFQSPLLSAASEPLHKPNRSRRPQSMQNRVNKFNPFRILG